jgi:hypothetical protein
MDLNLTFYAVFVEGKKLSVKIPSDHASEISKINPMLVGDRRVGILVKMQQISGRPKSAICDKKVLK